MKSGRFEDFMREYKERKLEDFKEKNKTAFEEGKLTEKDCPWNDVDSPRAV